MDIREREETSNTIHLVCEFENVFPKELSGLTPQREIDFELELIRGPNVFLKPHIVCPNRT